MRCVSWRAALALLALAVAISGEHSAATVDTPVLHIAADRNVDQSVVDKITLLAASRAAVFTVVPSGACHDKAQLTEKKGEGIIQITDAGGDCKQAVGNPRRLQIIYDKETQKLTTETGETIEIGDAQMMAELDKLLNLVVADKRKHGVKEQKQSSSVLVPIWSVIVLGVLVGVLLAANCIFFNKLRAVRAKSQAASESDKSKADASKRDSNKTSIKQKKKAASAKQSSSSASKSGKKSSKGKKKGSSKDSCRSSKSMSTKSCKNSAPTSVKVIATAPPAAQKKLDAARPLGAASDEVASVMALRGSSLPERTLDRVRASLPPTTVPLPTVTRQPMPPRPASMGPPIIPTVSVIGYAPSPFAVLATATSPLPPVSTPAMLGSAPTAYSSPSGTTVALTQPQSTPITTVAPAVAQPPPPPATVPQQHALPTSTVSANGPCPTTVAPIPLTLVPTSSPSSKAPSTVSTVTVPSPTVPSVSAVPVSAVPPPAPSTPVSTAAPSTPVTVAPPTVLAKPGSAERLPISPAYSLASTPASASPSSSYEKAPMSKRSQKK